MNVEWRLEPWSGNSQSSYIVKLDSEKINAGRGTFGSYLILDFEIIPSNITLLREEDLLLLSGMIGSKDEQFFSSLMIPAQVIGPNRSKVVVPISDIQIEALEETRIGGPVEIQINIAAVGSIVGTDSRLEGQGRNVTKTTAALHENNSMRLVKIERERWLELYESLGKGKRKLIEIPMPFLPSNTKQWEEAYAAYDRVILAEKRGEYNYAIQEARKVVEGITKTLLIHWSLPEKQRMKEQLDSIKDRLIQLWGSEQTERVKMITALLGTAWEFTSLSHHYGRAYNPLRSDAKFIIELIASLFLYVVSIVEQESKNI